MNNRSLNSVLLLGLLRVSFYAFILFAFFVTVRWNTYNIAFTRYHLSVCYACAFLADIIRMEFKK